MFTRKDYLEHRCSHDQYYAQFVDAVVIRRVLNVVGRERILKSTDPHFNDIPLTVWDRTLIPVPAHIAKALRERGDYATVAGAVCIAKAAAQQIKESEPSAAPQGQGN